MSVYSVPEASPSRVLGILRFLLATGEYVNRSTLEAMMTPSGLNVDSSDEGGTDGESGNGRALLQRALKETVRFGLLSEEHKTLRMGSGVNRKLIKDERWWPLALFELLADAESSNTDLCRALSWFLAQDVTSVPSTWNAMQSNNDVLTALEMNNASFGQLQHWAAYLGFGWRCGRPQRSVFVFDPTPHLKLRLMYELGNNRKEFPAPELLKQLAAWLPVLDGGIFRVDLEKKHVLAPLGTTNLSPTLSQSFRRLNEQGFIEMTHASDAKAVLLWSPEEQTRVSKIIWKGDSLA
jgi:hypothetical protein